MRRPTYRKVQEASKIRFRCCRGILCNSKAIPNGDSVLNHSSNVTALVVFDGFTSRRSGTDFLLKHALDFRERVAAALRPRYPQVSFSDVILSSICSSADGCRALLSFPCEDEQCRKADAARVQRRQLLVALPVTNQSVAIDFQVNLNASDNASHAALMLNSSDFKSSMAEHMSARVNATISLDYVMGPLPEVDMKSSACRACDARGGLPVVIVAVLATWLRP